MTVKECRDVLRGPQESFEVSVAYGNDEFNITDQSPVSDAFADYVVDCVMCAKPFKYTIFVKQEYVKREEIA